MEQKYLNSIGMLLILILFIFSISSDQKDMNRMNDLARCATAVFNMLERYDFDQIGLNPDKSELLLIKYEKEDQSSSALYRHIKHTIIVDDYTLNCVSCFRSIRKFRGGVFFAVHIGWDDVYTGLCIRPSNLTGVEDSDIRRLHDDIYWIDEIRGNVLREW